MYVGRLSLLLLEYQNFFYDITHIWISYVIILIQ